MIFIFQDWRSVCSSLHSSYACLFYLVKVKQKQVMPHKGTDKMIVLELYPCWFQNRVFLWTNFELVKEHAAVFVASGDSGPSFFRRKDTGFRVFRVCINPQVAHIKFASWDRIWTGCKLIMRWKWRRESYALLQETVAHPSSVEKAPVSEYSLFRVCINPQVAYVSQVEIELGPVVICKLIMRWKWRRELYTEKCTCGLVENWKLRHIDRHVSFFFFMVQIKFQASYLGSLFASSAIVRCFDLTRAISSCHLRRLWFASRFLSSFCT